MKGVSSFLKFSKYFFLVDRGFSILSVPRAGRTFVVSCVAGCIRDCKIRNLYLDSC